MTGPLDRKERTADRTGAFYGWTIVGVAFVAALTEVSFFNPVLGVFVRPLSDEFGWNRLTISLAISIGNVFGALLSPLAGAVLDRRGARLPMAFGAAVMGSSLLALAFTQALWWFYLFYFLGRGTAIGLVDMAIAVAVSNWFIQKRGLAMGFALLGNRMGMALLPLSVQLILLWADWRAAWIVLGIFVLTVAVVPALRFVRRRPEDMDLLPDGEVGSSMVSPMPLAETDSTWTVSQAVRTPSFWLLTLATSQILLISGGINLHQMPHLEERGLSSTLAVGVVAVFALTGGVGGLLAGYVRNRLGSRRTMVLTLAASSFGLVILVFADNAALAYFYGVWYGLSFGATVTVMGIIFADYFGRLVLGRIRGVVAPFNIAFNAAGPPLAGWAFDVSGSYVFVFSVFAALYLVAMVCIVLASPPASRWTGLASAAQTV